MAGKEPNLVYTTCTLSTKKDVDVDADKREDVKNLRNETKDIIKKLQPQQKIFSIIMLVFSVCCINVFNITAAILFLCIKKSE